MKGGASSEKSGRDSESLQKSNSDSQGFPGARLKKSRGRRAVCRGVNRLLGS